MNRKWIRWLLLPVLAVCLPTLLNAAPLRLQSNTTLANIGEHFQVLEDPSGALDIEQLRNSESSPDWQVVDQPIPSFGYSASTYWLRLAVTQEEAEPARHLVEIAYPVLEDRKSTRLNSSHVKISYAVFC